MDTAGSITRSVADAALLFEIIAGYDINDPITAWSFHQEKGYQKKLLLDGLKNSRIGFIKNLCGTEHNHKEVNKVFRRNLEEIKSLGAVIIPVSIEGLSSEKMIKDYSLQLFESCNNLGSYLNSLKEDSPVRSVQDLLKYGKLEPGVQKRIIKSCNVNNPFNTEEYKDRLIRRLRLQDMIIKVMADCNIDALVYPHQKQLVSRIGESQSGRNGILSAATGFPAITVPGGFSSPFDTAPIGVPVGLEFLGRPWSEGRLIEIAYSYEQGTKHRKSPLLTS
jgi:Asp-tRNA(Asn)/Glu-tRNA(Gln) amidotransferase A subunit family amidase